MSARRHTLTPTLRRVLFVGVVAALMIPPLHRSRERSRRLVCSNNLHQIGLAAEMIRSGRIFHDLNPLPKSYYDSPQLFGSGHEHLQIFFDKGYIDDPGLVICPAGHETPTRPSTNGTYQLGPESCSYLWARRGMMRSSPPSLPLAACRSPHGDGEGRNVLYLQGNVRWVPEEEFQRLAGTLTPE